MPWHPCGVRYCNEKIHGILKLIQEIRKLICLFYHFSKLRSCGAKTKKISIVEDTDPINTLRPRQNGRHFADDNFKRIFLNENVRLSIEISLKFVTKVPINNIPVLVQIMAWRRPGDKPLSEPMMVRLPTYICVTRPQWDIILLCYWCRVDARSQGFTNPGTDKDHREYTRCSARRVIRIVCWICVYVVNDPSEGTKFKAWSAER